MLALILLGAPVAYTALNLYLLARIQPIPITLLPAASIGGTRPRERVAA